MHTRGRILVTATGWAVVLVAVTTADFSLTVHRVRGRWPMPRAFARGMGHYRQPTATLVFMSRPHVAASRLGEHRMALLEYHAT